MVIRNDMEDSSLSSRELNIQKKMQDLTWWSAVEHIADIIVCEEVDIWDENFLSAELKVIGFDYATIQKSINWIQEAARTGRIQDTIGFIQERNVSRIRIENPTESAFLSAKLWKQLESLRIRGIVTLSLMEKLLVGIREIDTRDWEDDDVKSFIDSVLMINSDSASGKYEDVSDLSESYRPFC